MLLLKEGKLIDFLRAAKQQKLFSWTSSAFLYINDSSWAKYPVVE